MSGRGSKKLAEEDRILWNKVARTAVPLKGKAIEPLQLPPRDPGQARQQRPLAAGTAQPPAVGAAAASQPRISRLDAPTRNKLSRGRLPIEARVDLHGMTQSEAHTLLLSFLQRAQTAGLRHVLVITGKGSSGDGDGVLRRAVPGWLATSAFRIVVSGFDEAARRHGGGGAIYVRLRRLGPRQP